MADAVVPSCKSAALFDPIMNSRYLGRVQSSTVTPNGMRQSRNFVSSRRLQDLLRVGSPLIEPHSHVEDHQENHVPNRAASGFWPSSSNNSLSSVASYENVRGRNRPALSIFVRGIISAQQRFARHLSEAEQSLSQHGPTRLSA
jgi:hypothetical protein